jgi:hypothetical protein
VHNNEVSYWKGKVKELETDNLQVLEILQKRDQQILKLQKEKEAFHNEILMMKRLQMHISAKLDQNGPEPDLKIVTPVETPRLSLVAEPQTKVVPHYQEKIHRDTEIVMNPGNQAKLNKLKEKKKAGNEAKKEIVNPPSAMRQTTLESMDHGKNPDISKQVGFVEEEAVISGLPDQKRLNKKESLVAIKLEEKPKAKKMGLEVVKEETVNKTGLVVVKEEKPVAVQVPIAETKKIIKNESVAEAAKLSRLDHVANVEDPEKLKKPESISEKKPGFFRRITKEKLLQESTSTNPNPTDSIPRTRSISTPTKSLSSHDLDPNNEALRAAKIQLEFKAYVNEDNRSRTKSNVK